MKTHQHIKDVRFATDTLQPACMPSCQWTAAILHVTREAMERSPNLILMFKRLIKRLKVSLELFRMSVPQVIVEGLTVFTEMSGNAFFPTVPVPLATFQTALTNLQNAANAAAVGGPLETADMYQKLEIVLTYYTNLGHYVEDIANDPANAGSAETIILSAGMKVKKVTPRQKQTFEVLAGSLSGTVVVKAAAVKRGTHEWQYTLTPAVLTSWIALASTTKAHTAITGLTSGTFVYVRHRSTTKSGTTDWDGPAPIIVP